MTPLSRARLRTSQSSSTNRRTTRFAAWLRQRPMEGEVELRQVLAPGVAFAPVDEDFVELREQGIVRRRNHIACDAELEVLTGTECLREVGGIDGNVEREQVEHRVDQEAARRTARTPTRASM